MAEAQAGDPFAGLAAVLGAAPVQVDPTRQARKGVPEIVFAPGKTPQLLLAAVHELLARQPAGRVLVSRASAELVETLRAELEPAQASVVLAPSGGTVLVTRSGAAPPPQTGGVVGLLTAGASDAPAADEAAFVMVEMGCRVVRADDVGVAGLHRLLRVRDRMESADAIVVCAGMDGALPSVVGGLVDCPVIAVPTSIGYGASFGGLAALLTMLNACSAGVVTVNIDSGFKGGYSAALIARRAARAATRN